ncbi:hypothetical protein MPER_09733 [Moniliophthora perniciosa FA553]|nr:hypothetical protein MPER_09733 [Moniliophthora perniciosa FA553]
MIPPMSKISSLDHPSLLLKASLTAELASITGKGKKQLKELGVSKVFDLRSDTEIEKYNSPLPSIDGVEIVRTPVFNKEDHSPEMMAKYKRLWNFILKFLTTAGCLLDRY